MKAIQLYPYQTEVLEAVDKSWNIGKKSLLVAIPTGGGKTIIFSSIIRDALEGTGATCLILAHRDSLLTQADEKLHYVWPEINTSKVMAGKYDFSSRIIIASVQTLVNQLDNLPKIDYVVTDECHHAYSSTYKKIYAAVHAGNPDYRHLGVTATPVRMNKKESLRDIYEEITYSISIFRLIMEGYLSPVEGFSIETSLDLSKVRRSGEDYDLRQLSEAVQKGDFNEVVVDTFKRKASDRTAVCFAVDVNHVEMLARLFRQNGFDAVGLHGKLAKDEQKKILNGFCSGQHQVLVNCMIATEGFDHPPTDCVVMARPTKSIGLYTQMIGRGLRISPGKKECILLDFVDNSENSGLMTLKDLLSFYDMNTSAEVLSRTLLKRKARTKGEGAQSNPQKPKTKDKDKDDPLPPEEDRERTIRIDPRSISGMQAIEVMGPEASSSGALSKINLFDTNDFAWAPFDGNSYVTTRIGITLAIIKDSDDSDGARFNVYLCQSDKDNKWFAKLSASPVSYEFALAICNVYLFDYGDKILARKTSSWRGDPPKDGQISFFKSIFPKYKRIVGTTTLRDADFVTRGDYSNILSAACALVTIRDAKEIGRDVAAESLRQRVGREMSVIPFDTFAKLPWQEPEYNVVVRGATPDVAQKLKQLAAYLHSAFADGFPFHFFTASSIVAHNGSITINRDRYPEHTLTDNQYNYLSEKIYPVAKSLFPEKTINIER